MEPLRLGAASLGVTLDDTQMARFAALSDLLLDWNTRVNLTAITNPAQVVTLHFLDSLTCALALTLEERARPLALLDVGSGAGFPGLPLAIAFPHWRVTLLEATGKKTRFQEAVIAALGLKNANALNGRAEELARSPEHRGRYDVVTARAVAALPSLLEYCLPFTRPGGVVIAPKKGELTDEIAMGMDAARLLGAQLLDPIPVALSQLDDGRALLVARAVQTCPKQYPRAGGAPLKRPLGS
jgi:16S rRNA (guanine527-N7)-methyltransferase